MGAGKTTVGKQLSRALGRPFYDSDKEIEKRTGASIPLIFELEGETGFRRRETAILEELSHSQNTIIATGGGAILSEYNQDLMKQHGYVIYLAAPIEQLVKRTAKDKNRPLLQTEDPKKKITEILNIRAPIYNATANAVIDTQKKSVKKIVNEILDLVSRNKI